MTVLQSERGFEMLEHPAYLPKHDDYYRLASQSWAIGDYEDSFDRPGSSFLWIGRDHHLNREEVKALIAHLLAWIDTGSLEVKS